MKNFICVFALVAMVGLAGCAGIGKGKAGSAGSAGSAGFLASAEWAPAPGKGLEFHASPLFLF